MAKRILLVDDEPDMIAVTAFRLRKSGYEVITAVDGEEALNLISKENPDLVLLDLRVPKISGYDVCKKIKSDERLKNIPVIIFTASASRDMEDKVKEMGADGYLTKPFDSDELLARIAKFTGGQNG